MPEQAEGELVASQEVATLLGISVEEARAVTKRATFPEPIARLSFGKVWRRDDVAAWAAAEGLPDPEPTPEVVGATEVADLLGVTPTRVYQLLAHKNPPFPEPIATLGAGRIWRTADVVSWNNERMQRHGKHRKESA